VTTTGLERASTSDLFTRPNMAYTRGHTIFLILFSVGKLDE
jgi:hypothetical protein